jgi:class 3 adenylate cyclase
MKHIRKALADLLAQSLNTQQMNHLGREVDPNFSIYEISGFGEKIVIPRKVAADCVLQYFNTEQRLLEFIAFMFSREGHGMSGGVIQLKSPERLVQLLREAGWIYNAENARFQKDQSLEQTSGWGFMRAGQEYAFCFASIDVVASSELVRTNVKDDVETSMKLLYQYVQKHVDFWDGRIWSWYGDGGVAVFHGDHSAPMSALAMISILNYLPVFNIQENQLRAENDIKLRIGMHYGAAIFQNEVNKITSEDMKIAQEIEKHYSAPNALSVSITHSRLLPEEIRRHFRETDEYRGLKILQYIPT